MFEQYYYLASKVAPAAPTTYPDAVLALSPTAFWRLGESSGNAADSSGNGYTLTASGSLTYSQSGWPTDGDTAIAWGASGKFNIADATWQNPGTSDYSLSLCLKYASWPVAEEWVVAKNGGGTSGQWGLRTPTASTVMQVIVGNNNFNVSIGAALNDGAWHHLVLTCDRSDVATLYIDGSAMVDTEDISAHVALDLTDAGDLYLGGRAADKYFTGTMDEVAFWNGRLLTSGEVSTLYAAR